MARVLETGEGFWNIRGSFKLAGVVDIGTQCSLVRRKSGGAVLLDACALKGDVLEKVRALTDGGQAIEAILHLHPFHTVFAKPVHELFPKAKLYGTERHVRVAGDLPWEAERTDTEALHQLFADDLHFDVPRGVDFISKNERIHFSSVLAFHAASQTLHVDDTLNFTKLPLVGGLRFHPTLKAALERRPGAADAFRSWAQALAERCEPITTICAAHSWLTRVKPGEASMGDRVREALGLVEKTLAAHAKKFG